MSTLYGNDIAVKFARAPDGNTYPAGTVLTLVTWNQQEDSHWFGANIADSVRRVEKIIFGSTNSDGILLHDNFIFLPMVFRYPAVT